MTGILNALINLPEGEIIPKGKEVTVFMPFQTEDEYKNGKATGEYKGYTDSWEEYCFLYQSKRGVAVVLITLNQVTITSAF